MSTDRFDAVKKRLWPVVRSGTWSYGDDVRWLMGEVERLRAAAEGWRQHANANGLPERSKPGVQNAPE